MTRTVPEMHALATANLRLAYWRARRWLRLWPWADPDDLAQEACLALVRAAARWQEGRGVKFATYATRTIDQCLLRYLKEYECAGRVFRVPYESGRTDDPCALARRESQEHARKSTCRVRVLLPLPADDPADDDPADAEALAAALGHLTPRRREAVLLALDGCRGGALARRLGVSLTAAKNLRREAVNDLRKILAKE